MNRNKRMAKTARDKQKRMWVAWKRVNLDGRTIDNIVNSQAGRTPYHALRPGTWAEHGGGFYSPRKGPAVTLCGVKVPQQGDTMWDDWHQGEQPEGRCCKRCLKAQENAR